MPIWGRRHAEVFLELLNGDGFAEPNPRPMFPNPPGLLRLEPHSPGLRERIWWGAASNATAIWAAKMGMNLQSSTLKADETGEPFHVQQARQIRAYREAWEAAGHARQPRVSVSRSIFALIGDRDQAYFGCGDSRDQIGIIDNMRAVFGRSVPKFQLCFLALNERFGMDRRAPLEAAYVELGSLMARVPSKALTAAI